MPGLPHRSTVIVLILVVASLVSATQGIRNAVRPEGSQDNQWGPSRALLEHKNPYRLYLDYQVGKKLHTSPFILSQEPNYPAPGLILMWPYAAFRWEIAKRLWAASNLVFTFVILIVLYRLYIPHKPWRLLVVCTLLLCGVPHRDLLGNGQQALFCLAFFALSIALYQKHRFISGFCLAASLLKYTLTFPLAFFFIAKRRFDIIGIAAAIHVAMTLFAACWVNDSPLALMIGPFQVAQIATTPTEGLFDIFAIFHQVGLHSKILPACISISLMVMAVLLIIRGNDYDDLLMLTGLSFLALAVVFHADYDLVIMIFPLTYVVRDELNTRLSLAIASCVFVTYFFDKIPYLLDLHFHDSVNKYVLFYKIIERLLFYTCMLLIFIRIAHKKPIINNVETRSALPDPN
jgi:hypothetical protein